MCLDFDNYVKVFILSQPKATSGVDSMIKLFKGPEYYHVKHLLHNFCPEENTKIFLCIKILNLANCITDMISEVKFSDNFGTQS